MFFVKKLLFRLGFIALLAGLAPTTVALYSELFYNRAVAHIDDASISKLAISFTTADGKPMKMTVFKTQIFSNSDNDFLNPSKDIGRDVPILYGSTDGSTEPRVVHPFSFNAAEGIGLAVAAIGLIMLFLSSLLYRED